MELHQKHPHPLKMYKDMSQIYVAYGGNWKCDLCGRNGGVGMECYHCFECKNFDLCSACVGNNPTISSSHPHPLTFVPNPAQIYPHTSGGWKCDFCGKSGFNKKMYHCYTCTNFDLCENCVIYKV